MITKICNGTVLASDGNWVEHGTVVIDGDKIVDLLDADGNSIYNVKSTQVGDSCHADLTIDADGGYVMPGGIDLHVHGAGGRDFMEATDDAFREATAIHRRHGTTGIFPTLASASRECIEESAQVCERLMSDPSSGILGLHLEGPYFVPAMAGGQMPQYIRQPLAEEYVTVIEKHPCIKRWDAAPELPGSDDFARYLRSKGVVAGIAHTQADYEVVAAAHEAGYTMATHLYNAMTTTHKRGIYRHEGTVESILQIDGIDVEVIGDGIHVPPTLLRLVYKIKGAERMCLVTDALSVAESADAHSFDPRIVIGDGVCMLSDGSAIAGSVATMDRLIRTAVLKAGIPLADVSRMVSSTPARIMSVDDRKGSLAPAKDADIIIMDKDLNLTHVIVMGQEVENVCANSAN